MFDLSVRWPNFKLFTINVALKCNMFYSCSYKWLVYINSLNMSNSSVRIVKSKRGGDKLVVDGFIYHLQLKRENKYSWICDRKNIMKCKGRVTTILEKTEHVITKRPTTHVHDPNAYETEVHKANSLVRSKAAQTKDNPASIVQQSVSECEPVSRVFLPSKEAQKAKIKRMRNLDMKEPDNLSDILIPDHLRFLDGESFVLADESFEGNYC